MTPRRRETLLLAATLAPLLALYALIYLPYLPAASGRIAGDYSLWMPYLLAGDYWHRSAGWLALPWFTPSQCGGIPFYADPEIGYFSAPQILSFVVSPLRAVQATFLIFAAIGFAATWHLARRAFALSVPAAALAATLFLFNGFFASRVLIGHLPFHAFALLPVFCAALIRPPSAPRAESPEQMLRIAVAGLAVAAMIHAGMIHVVLPVFLSFAVILVLHALRFGANPAPVARAAAAGVLALCLSAGKLAAGLAFVSHFPRDQYSLPGIPGLFNALWLSFLTVFSGAPADPEHLAANSNWALSRHEWEYGVGFVPFALMAAALAQAAIRRRLRALFRPAWPWAALLALLLIPALLNWYQPDWNRLLKSLPLLGNSSNLLRYLSAYILPACLAGGLALDRLVPPPDRTLRPMLATAGIAAVMATAVFTDRDYYAQSAIYDVGEIEAAWHSPRVPPITDQVVLTGRDGKIVLPPERDNVLARGFSQLLCYEPIFGYRLENFPVGLLHPGLALSANADGLNVKNPACYVFPGANSCRPGSPFAAGQRAQAAAFLAYLPYPFAKPGWAHAADWLSLVASLLLLAAVPAAFWRHRLLDRR